MTRRERLEKKLEKREEWAGNRDADAERRINSARSIGSHIPLGQPILIGHHSEKRHRRDIERIDSNMRKSCESAKMADHHRNKAAGLASQLDNTVFSDDDNAIEALQERIADREAERERMKTANRAYKKGGLEAIKELLPIEELKNAVSVLTHQAYYQKPFPPYALTKLGANIRRDKKRIEEIKRRNTRQAEAEAEGGLIIKYSTDRSCCSVTFAEKPERDILQALRGAGFRWGGGYWGGLTADLPECVTELQEVTDSLYA